MASTIDGSVVGAAHDLIVQSILDTQRTIQQALQQLTTQIATMNNGLSSLLNPVSNLSNEVNNVQAKIKYFEDETNQTNPSNTPPHTYPTQNFDIHSDSDNNAAPRRRSQLGPAPARTDSSTFSFNSSSHTSTANSTLHPYPPNRSNRPSNPDQPERKRLILRRFKN